MHSVHSSHSHGLSLETFLQPLNTLKEAFKKDVEIGFTKVGSDRTRPLWC